MALGLSDLEARCAELMRARLPSNDPAHDVAHVERVVANARHLADVEAARLEIVVPAAWLHDCVILPKHSPRRREASRLAADEAAHHLAAWGCEPAWLPDIRHAIEAHSFSAKIAPLTIEARVVQDADRLDALGAVGLSRSVMLGGFARKPLYDAGDPFCERRPPDENASILDHFYTKLLGLSATMQTDEGRREAERRTAFLRTYLEELRRELAFSQNGHPGGMR